MKINPNNQLLEFACKVCKEKYRRSHPKMIDCAWRGIDNKYCPEAIKEYKKIKEDEE